MTSDLDDLWSDDQNDMIADLLADDHEAGKHLDDPDSRCERCQWNAQEDERVERAVAEQYPHLRSVIEARPFIDALKRKR